MNLTATMVVTFSRLFSLLLSAYLLILENDTNAEVRRAVLSCIAMSPRTLPKVLKRTRDIKENVRKLAYQVATRTSTEVNQIKLFWLDRIFGNVICFF